MQNRGDGPQAYSAQAVLLLHIFRAGDSHTKQLDSEERVSAVSPHVEIRVLAISLTLLVQLLSSDKYTRGPLA